VFADREPPGVEDAAAVVGVVPAVVGVVVLLPPDAVVVVVEPAPAAAVVVVVLPLDFLEFLEFFFELVPADALACLPVDFFPADGLDEPQAAAIRPATRTTPMICRVRARCRGARPGFGLVESVVVCMLGSPSFLFSGDEAGPETLLPPPRHIPVA